MKNLLAVNFKRRETGLPLPSKSNGQYMLPQETELVARSEVYTLGHKAGQVDCDGEILHEICEFLVTMKRRDRKRELKRVVARMDRFAWKSKRGIPISEAERQGFCTDIPWWFAEKLLDGTAEEIRVTDEQLIREVRNAPDHPTWALSKRIFGCGDD